MAKVKSSGPSNPGSEFSKVLKEQARGNPTADLEKIEAIAVKHLGKTSDTDHLRKECRSFTCAVNADAQLSSQEKKIAECAINLFFHKELEEKAMTLFPHDIEAFFSVIRGEDDPIFLKHIALQCAEVSPDEFLEIIQDFEIQDQDTLVEIATLLAQTNPLELACYFQGFQIQSSDMRFQIAKICFENSTDDDIAEFIANFEITDQRMLLEIATIHASNRPGDLIQNIDAFKITDEEALAQVAMTCFEADPSVTSRFFKKFNITEQTQLLKLTNFLLKLRPDLVAMHIKKFRIENEQARFEIAMQCAEADPSTTAQDILKFNITDQHLLSEIAFLLAQRRPASLCEYINKFSIDDPETRIKIITVFLSKMPESFAQYFPFFKIEDESFRLLAAQNFASKHPRLAVKHIDNFKLSKAEDRAHIAQICVRLDAQLAHTCLVNFALEDRQLITSLAALSIEELSSFKIDENVLISEYEKAVKGNDQGLILRLNLIFSIRFSQEFLFPKGIDFFNETVYPMLLSEIEKHEFRGAVKLSKLQETPIRSFSKSKCCITYMSLVYLNSLDLSNVSPAVVRMFETTPQNRDIQFVHVAFNTISRYLKYSEKGQALEIDPHFCAQYDRAVLNAKGAPLTHLALTLLIPATWTQTDEDKKNLALIKSIFQTKEMKSLFRNSLSGVEHLWVYTCQKLNHSKILSPSEKLALLTHISLRLTPTKAKEEFPKRIGQLLCLLSYEEYAKPFLAQFIVGLNDPNFAINSFLAHAEVTLLNSDPFLDLGKVEHLADKYLNTFAKYRIAGSWRAYGARLKELDDPVVQAAYNKFILSVLEGEFLAVRYSGTESPHIQRIQKHHQDVWLKWMEEVPAVENAVVDGKEYLFVNTDQDEDIFPCGSEVGSCQAVTYSPELSKGLLAYLLDGKIRLLAFKSPSSKKIAYRALIKIMWDKKSSRPAIFLEKTYPISRTSTEFQKQFEKHAIEQGKRLGVSVFIAPSEDSPKKSCHTLASLGGQAPYEYSDATRRLTDGGKYEHEAFCIYDGHPPALAN